MNIDNPSYLNLRLFNDNFDEEDDDKSDNSLRLKDLHETTTIEPVDVDIEPITPPDFNMTVVELGITRFCDGLDGLIRDTVFISVFVRPFYTVTVSRQNHF